MQIGTPFKKAPFPDCVDLELSFPTTTTPGTTSVGVRAPRTILQTKITYAATGQYQVVTPPGTTAPNLPHHVAAHAQISAVGNIYNVHVVGEVVQSSATGQITINLQTVDYAGVANAPAAAAGSRINLSISLVNNGGG